PQRLVLAEGPDRLLGGSPRPRAAAYRLRHAGVGDPETVPVAGVVLERAHGDVGVELRGQALGAPPDQVDGRLLAAAQLTYQRVEVAALEQALHVRVGELGEGGGALLVLPPQDLADGTALQRAASAAPRSRGVRPAPRPRAYAVASGVVLVVLRQVVSSVGGQRRGADVGLVSARRLGGELSLAGSR